jgi:hypothetical protein
MALTRIPRGPYSTAICRVIAITPPFAAVYGKIPGTPIRPPMLAWLRITPDPRSSMCGSA